MSVLQHLKRLVLSVISAPTAHTLARAGVAMPASMPSAGPLHGAITIRRRVIASCER